MSAISKRKTAKKRKPKMTAVYAPCCRPPHRKNYLPCWSCGGKGFITVFFPTLSGRALARYRAALKAVDDDFE